MHNHIKSFSHVTAYMIDHDRLNSTFILTRYPEAVVFPSIGTELLANALCGMFINTYVSSIM